MVRNFWDGKIAVSLLNEQNKSVSLSVIGVQEFAILDWSRLSNTVTDKLGKDAFVFLHIDEFQNLFNEPQVLKSLYSVIPCSKNVKMIISGTTALGNDKIQGMSEFDAIACSSLNSFLHNRVHLVLNKVVYWEEMKIEGKTELETQKIKYEIEIALQGTPKIILYFLQALYKSNAKLIMSKEELFNILETAYFTYSEKQQKMLSQLLEMGNRYSTYEETNLFEKIVIIFSFPEDFGFIRNGCALIGKPDNDVIKLLTPFNHSGLVRIYKESNSVVLSIPNNFTIRYIQEHTLYFPKEWLQIFNSTCDVSSNVSSNVRGYSIQIWIAIMLLNQHSVLSTKIQSLVKEQIDMEIYEIYYGENAKKSTFSTFDGEPEQVNITGPSIVKDGKRNPFVDIIIPFSAKNSHKKFNSEIIPFLFQITCRKDNISQHAKNFFEKVAQSSNSKSNQKKKEFYSNCVAVYITLHPLEATGKNRKAVNNYLQNNKDFILLELSNEQSMFPNLDINRLQDAKELQKWIKNSDNFMNIINSGNTSPPRSENFLDDKSLSPYGSTKKKKTPQTTQQSQLYSNVGSSQIHALQATSVWSSQIHLPSASVTTSTPTLQRASGKLNIGDIQLDKSNPKSWKSDQIRILLTDTDVGVGFEEEQLKEVKVYGSDFEIVVDALLSYNGDKEAKIEHATKKLNLTDSRVGEAITRWVFANLLDT